MGLFSENNLPVCALLPDADLYAADPATDVYNMKLYDRITFWVIEGAGGTGTAKIEVEECTSAAGAGNTAIAFDYRLCANAGTADTWGARTAATSAGYTTVAGANKMVEIEIKAADLSEGSNFVRLQLTEVADSPCDACVMAVLSEPRYSGAVMPTAVS